MPDNTPVRWEVQTRFAYGWENVWLEETPTGQDGSVVGVSTTYATMRDALIELSEHLAYLRSAGMSANREDYRVVPVGFTGE